MTQSSFLKFIRRSFFLHVLIAHVVVLGLLTLYVHPARAAVITVTTDVDGPIASLNGNGACDLREAIEAANTDTPVNECPGGSGADTIVLAVTGLMFMDVSEGQFIIDSDITLEANGTSFTIDGMGGTRIFLLQPSSTLQLQTGSSGAITLFRGNGNGGDGGCIYVSGALLQLQQNVIVDDCDAGDGGGIYVDAGSVDVFSGASVQNNDAAGSGGGIYATNLGSVFVDGSVFMNDASGTLSNQGGGGIYADNGSFVNIATGAVSGNSSGSNGGGIAAVDSTTTITSNVSQNSSNASGGGVYIKGGSADISGDILANQAAFSGGGIYVEYGGTTSSPTLTTVNVFNAFIDGNNANGFGGGGILVDGFNNVDFSMADSTVSNNGAPLIPPFGNGGGVALAGLLSSTVISNVTIRDNQARNDGGGLWMSESNVTLTGSSLVLNNNASLGNGGGLWASQSNVTLTGSSLVFDNIATTASTGNGGGIYAQTNTVLNLSSLVSIYGNSATRGGGIYLEESARMTGTDVRLLNNLAYFGGGAFYGEPTTSTSTTRSCTNCCIVANGDDAVVQASGAVSSNWIGNWWGSDFGPYIASAGTNTASGTSTGDSISTDGTLSSGVYIGITVIPTDYGSESTGGDSDWLRLIDGDVPLDCQDDLCSPVSSLGRARLCAWNP